ncbi:MAG: hypothetical protein UU08_C0018G0023 [Candidatus Uhrbacteria bacterium GW2011_GWE2_40_58]|nr:MAG: hypothetical protein UT94_C0022G0003 [Candidatus Uhrbacteria bacterium GW2011_GWF2_40_263]KKR67414.1 MAG: hypothetical protein UU08_C0018G0023 [Candidatus Uhrbacteria bacterium GW2011_GWE2_40_58]OGL94390.1 MAG: hypothetical protein A2239_00425 [Candidatus Uhrbacteria bacterium RIFOXYA2_FULL_40_9]OGL98156.1 MAG: hypothetical protein A2332_03000 [Candidatus Uhrbacteria bacterium RIFOXYB2_FULL_41_18]HBK34571.1 hypothetical protein [Candidatus Uhrbacteria bacterium]
MEQDPLPVHIRLDELISFWSKASSQTYASGRKPKRLANGWKRFIIKEGSLSYEDTWYSIHGRSFGQILIRIKDIGIVWQMSYEGFMKPEAKEMLLCALRMGTTFFLGGRGPACHIEKGLIYHNESQGDFTEFSGIESIKKLDGSHAILEKHSFRGGLLVTLSA